MRRASSSGQIARAYAFPRTESRRRGTAAVAAVTLAVLGAAHVAVSLSHGFGSLGAGGHPFRALPEARGGADALVAVLGGNASAAAAVASATSDYDVVMVLDGAAAAAAAREQLEGRARVAVWPELLAGRGDRAIFGAWSEVVRAAAAAGYARAVVVERGAAASRESVAGVVAALRAGAAVAVPAAVNTRAAPRAAAPHAAPVRGASLIADILALQPAAAAADGGAVAPTFPSVPTMSSCVVGFSLDRARRFGFSTPNAAMGGPLGGGAPRIVAHLEAGRVGAAATEGAATCAADSAWARANVTVTDLARPFSPLVHDAMRRMRKAVRRPPPSLDWTLSAGESVFGCDFERNVRQPATVAACELACADSPKCRAFTFVVGEQLCVLKNCVRLSPAKGHDTYIRGPKIPGPRRYARLPGVAVGGCDFERSELRDATLDVCQRACTLERRCRAFSHLRDLNICYLKSCASTPTTHPAFDTYVKPDTCVAAPPPQPLASPKKVAVVITVHDAPEWVERTLTSLWAHADSPAGRALPDAGDAIFLVNDASGAETLRRLREVVEARGRARRLAVRLVNWDGGHRLDGYTRAANLGIRAARREAPYAAFCLLNSDVEVVDPRWLETLKRHAFSDPTIGVVGPLSNAASYQSVPALRVQTGKESEDWSKNELPPGPADDPWTPRGVAAAVARGSRRRLVDVPVLNGFCLFVKAEVVEAVGLMDEVAFPHGFGEENDFALRALAAGYSLKVADDVYVWHHKSKSYGDATRQALSAGSAEAMRERWGSMLRHAVGLLETNQELAEARRRVGASLTGSACGPGRLRVLFVLNPQKEHREHEFQMHGGWISIVNEALGLRDRGACAQVAMSSWLVPYFDRAFPQPAGAPPLVLAYGDAVLRPEQLADALYERAAAFDVVVATLFTTVEPVNLVAACHPNLLPAYFIQDYEVKFARMTPNQRRRARESYTLYPRMLSFAKTEWLRRRIRKAHGTRVAAVRGTIALERFHAARAQAPRPDADAVVVFVAMVRPSTPRRNAGGTMRVLEGLRRRLPGTVATFTFGCVPSEFDALLASDALRELRLDTGATEAHRRHHLGTLDQDQIAALFARAHVFLDMSHWQAFGRAGLEAMASGCVAVVPADSGSEDYAVDGVNARLVSTKDEAGAVAVLAELARDAALRARLRARALETVEGYALRAASATTLRVLCDALDDHADRAFSVHVPCRDNPFLDFSA